MKKYQKLPPAPTVISTFNLFFFILLQQCYGAALKPLPADRNQLSLVAYFVLLIQTLKRLASRWDGNQANNSQAFLCQPNLKHFFFFFF